MRKAVVSTTLGAEGLELTPDEHLLIADQPEPFARTVADLMTDRERRHQLAEAGHKQVCRRYRWESIAKVQTAFLESLTADRKSK